jgi:hypothetical protein
MDKPLSLFTKIVFWIVSLHALAGAGSLVFFPDRTDLLFFWEIKPPINAALFGALYFGGAVVVGWIALKGYWEPGRFLVPVLVSAGIFITLTTFLHLDRFGSPIKLIYWLIIYIGAPILALLVYFIYERNGANWSVAEPVNIVTRIVAILLGAVLLMLGIFIIVLPGLVVPYWPWPTSPLMVRIFASWFSAFGVGLLWFIFDHDWRRLHLIATLMIASSILDLAMIVIHRADLTSTGLNLWVYCFHLILFGAVGFFMNAVQLLARLLKPVRPIAQVH